MIMFGELKLKIMEETENKYQNSNEVVVKDINMSFSSMVFFMVKWAIAAIPAAIILFVIVWLLIALLGISTLGL